jgi:hypothetical protein
MTNRDWSGMRESNPRLDLGKVAYYHYTNPAKSEFTFIACRLNANKFPRQPHCLNFQGN